MTENRMYMENRKSINFFVGCLHNCTYCKPSFQRQMKRQGKRCEQCYNYVPHDHLERLDKRPPKTYSDEFIFFPSASDWTFIPQDVGDKAIEYMKKYHDRKFLCQTKDPACFGFYKFPGNAILGITLETNIAEVAKAVSDAPSPEFRYMAFKSLAHANKIVTVEPVLNFNLVILTQWIRDIKPMRVYVGFDNHGCHLDEPSESETLMLIQELRRVGLDVREKGMRKAWWEPHLKNETEKS